MFKMVCSSDNSSSSSSSRKYENMEGMVYRVIDYDVPYIGRGSIDGKKRFVASMKLIQKFRHMGLIIGTVSFIITEKMFFFCSFLAK